MIPSSGCKLGGQFVRRGGCQKPSETSNVRVSEDAAAVPRWKTSLLLAQLCAERSREMGGCSMPPQSPCPTEPRKGQLPALAETCGKQVLEGAGAISGWLSSWRGWSLPAIITGSVWSPEAWDPMGPHWLHLSCTDSGVALNSSIQVDLVTPTGSAKSSQSNENSFDVTIVLDISRLHRHNKVLISYSFKGSPFFSNVKLNVIIPIVATGCSHLIPARKMEW